MNADLIRVLSQAYQMTDDESIKAKICRLICDEASKEFPAPPVSGMICEDCGEYLSSPSCCTFPVGV